VKTKRPRCIAGIKDVKSERYVGPGIAGKSWNLGRAAGAGRLGVDVTEISPSSNSSRFHCHGRKEEFFFVLSGRCRLRLGRGEHELGAGDAVSRPAGTGVCHQFRNPYKKPCRILMVGVQTGSGISDRVEYPESGETLIVRADGRRGIFRRRARGGN